MSPRYTCEEIQEALVRLVDGEADDVQCELARRHLEECPDCQAEYEQDCRLKELVRRSCACEAAPAPLRDRILSRIGCFTVTQSSTTVMWADGDQVTVVETHTTTVEAWEQGQG